MTYPSILAARTTIRADKGRMLGYTHAASGAAVWLIAAPSATLALGTPLTPAELAAGTLACAGAALVPDLDHPQATVSNTFGPVSHSLSKFVQLASGGHRHATHSFLFALLMGVATWGLTLLNIHWLSLGLMFVLAAFAIRGLNLVPPRASGITKSIVVILEAAALVWLLDQGTITSWWWLGPAMTIGCLAHLGGDCCTPERCPLLWPKKTRYGFGLISHTGNAVEKRLIGPGFILLTTVLLYLRFAHEIHLPWN